MKISTHASKLIKIIYLVTFTIMGNFPPKLLANLGTRAEGVPTNNQREEDQGPVSLEEIWTCPVIYSSTALLVRVQCFRKGL